MKKQIQGSDRRLQELTLLFHVSQILDQNLDMREVVGPVLEALSKHLDMQHGTLTLLNRKTGDILIELKPLTACRPNKHNAASINWERV